MTDMSLAYLMTDLSLSYSMTYFFLSKLWYAYSASWLQWCDFVVIIINFHATALCWLNMYLELIPLIPHITREGMSVPEQGLAYCWLVCPGYWSNNTDTPVMSTKKIIDIHIFIDDRAFILISMYCMDRYCQNLTNTFWNVMVWRHSMINTSL